MEREEKTERGAERNRQTGRGTEELTDKHRDKQRNYKRTRLLKVFPKQYLRACLAALKTTLTDQSRAVPALMSH